MCYQTPTQINFMAASRNSAARRASDLMRVTLLYTRLTASAKFWRSKSKQLRELVLVLV